MRRVYILRHAKTESLSFGATKDFERNLLPRGKQDAKVVAEKWIKENECPQIILSSTANRAKETTLIFANTIQFPLEKIQWRAELYMADFVHLDKILNTLPDDIFIVLIIAHNMGLTDYANMKIADFRLDVLPTASCVGFELDLQSWQENSIDKKGKFLNFYSPKIN